MSLLQKVMKFLDRRQGDATTLTIALILGLLAVGLYFKYYVKESDTPAEQVVETILSSQGIDIDFSADKE